ncbi:S-adenosyl-L-methionine-dependent methyltransferase [Immersiella caudata]|uniref:S-adenosyl-L-methionine-dependent methyltransferase n=1 Tax=Immersiella caudata TaxID=314043 RepID=A0AA39XH24_9PEZI|nr:S-adenosyl-L-methionine-dependent methyltransferase [Immersiella caudata]
MNTARLIADSESDRDSALDAGDDVEMITIHSAVMRYRQENGRTYHAYKDGSYLLPNDQSENERLAFQHYLFLLTFNDQLHIAPIPKRLHRALDAGCGTGDWTIDFADLHPECHVTGVDLSPIQPAYNPPNVSFIVDDLEDTWAFGAPFDFIFSRFMTGSISNWPEFFHKCYDSLRPGGTIELQDSVWRAESDDGTVPPDCHLVRWVDLLRHGMEQFGRPLESALYYKEQLEAAGFVDVVQLDYKWPTNHWPKDRRHKMIGKWNNENIVNGSSGISLALLTRPKEQKGLGWTVEEVEVLLEGVGRDLKDTSIHAYFPLYVVYGTKPE